MALSRRQKIRRLALGFVLAAVLGLGCFALSPQLLTVANCPARADCIVVLGGANWVRVPRAVELYQAGAAPFVLITGHGDAADSVAMLRRAGVPDTAILVEDRSTSTRENAAFSVPLLREHGCRSALVVTSWYHSRRGLACFRRAEPDIQFHSCPAGQGSLRLLWESPYERGRVALEWGKLGWYWVVHWIPPW
ncbi:MAG: YdcF family protein [Limisphaerales bacterium]